MYTAREAEDGGTSSEGSLQRRRALRESPAPVALRKEMMRPVPPSCTDRLNCSIKVSIERRRASFRLMVDLCRCCCHASSDRIQQCFVFGLKMGFYKNTTAPRCSSEASGRFCSTYLLLIVEAKMSVRIRYMYCNLYRYATCTARSSILNRKTNRRCMNTLMHDILTEPQAVSIEICTLPCVQLHPLR